MTKGTGIPFAFVYKWEAVPWHLLWWTKWLFPYFLFVCCRCPVLERPEIVLRSFGSIGTCRDRIDATVCISNHSLALRHPRDSLNYLGVSHQMANFRWMISAVYPTKTWNAWSQVVKFLFWPASNDLTKSSCPSFSIHLNFSSASKGDFGRRVANLTNLFAKHFALILDPLPGRLVLPHQVHMVGVR